MNAGGVEKACKSHGFRSNAKLVANEIVIHRLSTLVTGIARRKPD